MIRINNQNGMTAISWAAVLGLGAVMVLIALKLLPIYLEIFNVSSHVSKLNEDGGLQDMSDEEILITLQKRFSIDNVESVKNDDVIITRDGSGVTVAVDYEVRKSLLGNVDAVVVFSSGLSDKEK